MSLSPRQPLLNILKESLVDFPKAMQISECSEIGDRRLRLKRGDRRVVTTDELVEIGD
jgi:hypothetical protein